jgi:Ca2+-binding RTX toxin-like protein
MKKITNNRPASRNVAIETLEDRRLYSATMSGSVLLIVGTHASSIDVIQVSESGGNILVTEGTTNETLPPPQFFAAANVTAISISTGDGDDRISLDTSKPITVYAGKGHDTVTTSTALYNNRPLTVYAGEGNDYIDANTGFDYLFGDAGNDTIYAGAGNDYIDGVSDNDRIYGEDGNDTMHGSSGNDTLYGGAGHDGMNGQSGSDQLFGGSGNDSLGGAAGRDSMYGESGDDYIHAGDNEADHVDGGIGNDTAVYDRTWVYVGRWQLLDTVFNCETHVSG